MATYPNPATRLRDGIYEVYTPGGFEDIMGSREIFVPANMFLTHAGSGALTGTAAGSGNFPGWALDSAADEAVSATIQLPDSWDAVAADILWSNASTGAGAVRWDLTLDVVAVGAASGAGTVTSVTATASTTAFLLVRTAVVAESAAVPVTAGAFLRMLVNRDANHAADTVANDASFHGVILTKVG